MTTMPEYFKTDGCERQFFPCDQQRSTISTEACAANWRKARDLPAGYPGALFPCVGCKVGAAHAGEEVVERSRLFGSDLCARCRRGGMRVIGGKLCVSCWNRNMEYQKGRNSKGRPVTFAFNARRLGVILNYGEPDQRRIDVRDEYTANSMELAVQTLKIAPRRVAFCRAGGGPVISTADLARRLGKQLAANRPPMFRRTPPPSVAAAQPRRPRQRPPAIDRLPNELRHTSALDLRSVRERLIARRASA
jgi:hypothetical protein